MSGPFAFPTPDRLGFHGDVKQSAQNGMEIRDLFAAFAMAALILEMDHGGTWEDSPGDTAELAYRFAEAMMDVREGLGA